MTDFTNKYGTWAVIAGGSEGIGEQFAYQLAARGLNLVLLARREQPLAQCAARIGKKYPDTEVKTIAVDLCSDQVLDVIRPVCDGLEVGLLIYNAGATHGHSRFLDEDISSAISLVKLNCHTPLVLAHHFGQEMRERQRGGMIFLTSMVGLAGSSHVVSYSATKAFDHVLGEALWHDLAPDNIDVLCLVVGATDTPAASRSKLDFKIDSPGDVKLEVMRPEEVARGGLDNLSNGPLWVVGEHNRAIVPLLFNPDRSTAVELLSYGTAAVNGLEYRKVGSD